MLSYFMPKNDFTDRNDVNTDHVLSEFQLKSVDFVIKDNLAIKNQITSL